MKRVLFLTCIGSLTLALTAWGAPNNKSTSRSAKGRSAPRDHVVSAKGEGHTVGHAGTMRASRVTSGGRVKPSAVSRANTVRGSHMEPARSGTAVNRERNFARANTLRTNRTGAAKLRSTQTAQANARIGAGSNRAVNRGRNVTMGSNVGSNVAVQRGTNAAVVNNWRSDRFRDPTYTAFYNYTPQWHDRTWWTGHYSNITFVLGGWWYWDAGYWYPAWGYDPYAWYPYDGPIYTGYAALMPDRVVVEVQTALRQDGYYAGPIDGRLGPRSRAALAAFQADHDLTVTSAIDRPTLQTLGVA